MKRKKRKLSKVPTEAYQVKIEDWEVRHSFIGKTSNHIRDSEDSCLMLYGTLTSPGYKDVTKVQIYLWTDERWDKIPSEKTISTIGMMQVLRDKVTLDMTCSIPSQLFSRIQVSLVANKIKHVQVYGEKLRWERAFMYNIVLATRADED
jgi:hypothetical protein